ncbi:hypothetical protein Leryth_019166 [Lithospermum erythrorhizon]|nr:hypothetical protein Leryth_019166 [Lithospermum erythrorhizon]
MAAGRKRRRVIHEIVPKLLPDAKVEVRSLEEGFFGSWHSATVISGGDLTRNVQYDHLLSDEGTDYITECVNVSSFVDGEDNLDGVALNYRGIIRPFPPCLDLSQWSIHYGECVDMYHNDAWWEGVIFDHEDGSEERKIFFPDMGDEMKAHVSTLRITQDWDEMLDNWKPRGNWLFLELIEEMEQHWPLIVSVKQIWYETRLTGFQDIKEWTNADSDSWKKWVLQVWYDNLKIAINQIFIELNSSGLLQEDQQLLELSESDLDAILKPGSFTGNSFPIVPFGFPHYFNSHDPAFSSMPSLEEEVPFLPSTLEPKPSSPNHCSEIVCEENGKESPSQMTKQKIEWLPVAPDMLPGPGLYPDAVFNYGDGQSKKRKLIHKIKGHLLCLGYKIYFNRDNITRLRYVSPEGIHYYSLRELCRLLKGKSQFRSPLHDNKQRTPSLYAEDDQLSFLPITQGNPGSPCSSDSVIPSLKRKAKRQKKKSEVRVNCTKSTEMNGKKSHSLKARKLKNRVEGPSLNDVKAFIERQVKIVKNRSKRPVTDSHPIEVEFEENSFKQGRLSEKIQSESSSGMLLSEYPAKPSKADNRATRKGKKRNSSVGDNSPRQTKRQEVVPQFLNNGHTSQPSSDLGENGPAYCSTRVLRSSKRAVQDGIPSLNQSPRTVLSWLIENNVVGVGEKVYYRERDSESIIIQGKITRDGIICGCCHCTFSISKFEVHAGSSFCRPAANIFLEDGKTLLNCQLQMEHERRSKSSRMKSHDVKGNHKLNMNDYICSVCHDGGNLVLCDHCPSSYHKECVGLKVLPEGDWFCPSCCCAVCGNNFDRNTEFESDNRGLRCSQCERQYHVRCLHDKAYMQNTRDLDGIWFCNTKCKKIFEGLHQLLGKAVPVGDDNLTWTLVKYREAEDGKCDGHDGSSVATYSKLNVALSVMHECFLPIKEPLTKRDLIEDMIFCRRSELRRLSFPGFYTVLLEKNDELITTATVRVYGEKLAEVPFVATRFHFRRSGMCRILMDELEKKLMELGVERLVLPAVETALDTWTTSFGFSKMTMSDRLSLLNYTFLNFQGAIICQKLLQENIPSTLCLLKDGNSADSEVYQEDHDKDYDCRSRIHTPGINLKKLVQLPCLSICFNKIF